MKKNTKKIIIICGIVLMIILLSWFIGKKIIIYNAVNKECKQYKGQEQWITCAAQVALSKNNAAYCNAGGVFNPFTKLCVSEFANKVSDQKYCKTIWKPEYRKICENRFKYKI